MQKGRPITSAGKEISTIVAEHLTTLALRVKPAVSADQLWNRVLTSDERDRLGGDLEKAWRELGTAGMWMKLRGESAERAVIDIAVALNHLDEWTAQWLLREIGEETVAKEPSDRPVWSRDTGALRFGGKTVRQVRIRGNPSRLQIILDAFQAAGWPVRIDNPLSDELDENQTRQAVLFLNDGLQEIRFHVQEAGRAITWSRS